MKKEEINRIKWLYLARLASLTGTQILFFAMPLLIYGLTHSVGIVAFETRDASPEKSIADLEDIYFASHESLDLIFLSACYYLD